MTKCTWCLAKTQASGGRCLSCKSKRHHALKRIKTEGLIVDTPLGNHSPNWWVWDKKGAVLVIGKNSYDEAVRTLALGDVADDDKPRTSDQLDRDSATVFWK